MQHLSLWSRVFAFGAGLILCAIGPHRLQAQQDSATIAGTVLDQEGKPIPNANVEVKSEANGASRTVTTDAEGHFSATDLAAGSYSILVTAPGFAITTSSGQQVTTGATQNLSVTLGVESVATSI